MIGNYYNSISSDILYDYPISSISGATATKTNLGTAKIRNRGFDFQVDARVLTGKVNWNVSANVSVNRNKVVSMGGLDDIISTTERSGVRTSPKRGIPSVRSTVTTPSVSCRRPTMPMRFSTARSI